MEAEDAAAIGVERGEHRLTARHGVEIHPGQRGETPIGRDIRFAPLLVEGLMFAAILIVLSRCRLVGRQGDEEVSRSADCR